MQRLDHVGIMLKNHPDLSMRAIDFVCRSMMPLYDRFAPNADRRYFSMSRKSEMRYRGVLCNFDLLR